MALSNKQLAKKRNKANAKKKAQANACKNQKRKSNTNIPKPTQSRHLVGAYWGYKANLPQDNLEGFEFSTVALHSAGIPNDLSIHICECIKQAADRGVQLLVNSTDRAAFIANEQSQLPQFIKTFNTLVRSGTVDIADVIEPALKACCAISILVAAGVIPQDEYNGDSFMWSSEPLAKMAA
jgi:hypothetical protein